ncbi:MAG: transcription elongation factor GreA, partial [Phycisphaerales bacterium]|nr:transcription elongation factor GreA [Phycisphaerales bacterium]
MDFMTADEKAQLQEKLSALVAKRPEISNRIAEARALGDLKENAEYHAAREDQAMMEAEIRRL